MKERRKGRPPLDPRVRSIIMQEATRNREADRKEVVGRIEEKLKEESLQLPTFKTLLREISDARRADEALDRPWSLLSLPTNPLPAEGLPYVLKVWAYTMTTTYESPETKEVRKVSPLTIREALWVGHIWSVFKAKALGDLGGSLDPGDPTSDIALPLSKYEAKSNHIATSMPTTLEDIDRLWELACRLAAKEKMLKAEGSYPNTREEMVFYWLSDAEVYAILPDGEPAASDLTTSISQEFRSYRDRKEPKTEKPKEEKGGKA